MKSSQAALLLGFILITSPLSLHASRLILENADTSEISNEVSKHGGQVIRKMEYFDGVVADLPSQSIKALQKKFPGLSVTEDIELKLVPHHSDLITLGKPGSSGVSQPPESVPWGITAIRAPQAHASYRGTGVTVCVVDTGIDKTHPDLAANVVGGKNFVSSKGSTNPLNWIDDNGHGSHVAGIIAAVDNTIGSIGVAPDAKLYGVKVLDRRGSGYLSDIADGIVDCVNAGSDVINMSLGGDMDPNLPSPMKSAVDFAVSQGVVVVVAAGNEGQNISGKVPAGYSNVIAVSAHDNKNAFPSFSNFGLSTKDFAAPGVSIFSTWKSGGYNTISGTSMASPHVAGVVALKLSANSKGLLATDIGATISRQGAGRIDALSTVNNK